MKILCDYEGYKELLIRNKNLYRGGYNNNYLSTEKIKQYIETNRMFYEENESGVIIYLDEISYYRCILMANTENELNIHKLEKPVFVRNIYDVNKKLYNILNMEKILKRNGFKNIETSTQIVCKVKDREDEYRKNNDKCLSFLNRVGIKMEYVDISYYDDIYKLRENTPELKFYQFPHEEFSDIKADFENGFYRCAINSAGEVVGAQHFSVKNGTVDGDWLSIKDEYKVKYGIGRAMAYNSFVYALDHGFDIYYGWVVDTNSDSINYHKSIGYRETNKRSDEWLLE